MQYSMIIRKFLNIHKTGLNIETLFNSILYGIVISGQYHIKSGRCCHIKSCMSFSVTYNCFAYTCIHMECMLFNHAILNDYKVYNFNS